MLVRGVWDPMYPRRLVSIVQSQVTDNSIYSTYLFHRIYLLASLGFSQYAEPRRPRLKLVLCKRYIGIGFRRAISRLCTT